MDRITFINEITAARTRLEAALARFTNEQMTQPDLPGGWSVKDLLAHLGWWQRRVAMIHRALKEGVRPETVLISGTIDELNERVLAESRAADLEEVRKMERQAYQDLLAIAETAPEEELFGAHTFAWTDGRPFADWLAGDTFEHFTEHLPALENRLAELEGALRTSAEAAETAPEEEATPAASGPQLHPVIARVRDFLDSEGREFDRMRFDFHFGSLPADDLLDQLGRYQNEDGGFHSLEVDIQSPLSNPFASELALATMVWAGQKDGQVITHMVAQKAVNYLEETQHEDGTWRFVPGIYEQKLAPWFQGWQWPNFNPSGQIAGALKTLGIGSDQLHSRVQTLFETLANPDDLRSDDFYRVLPYAGYLSTEWDFPQAEMYRWGVVWWLVRQASRPEFEAASFFQLAPRPDSAIARRLPAPLVEAQLDQLQAAQLEDGGWPTPYDPRWRPWDAVNNLLVLRSFGRL